ncbi:precorrin-2 C(20)-methyltransferase [Desulfococcaceae bacterium HSG8]|nr:precorrin-2 C(20)-methyltransferase [Desulfococcaceae bacterium HSG8]
MNDQIGTFYGIGVGPGDPELLTLKAVRIINKVDVIFAASSIKNNYSLAVDIAKLHISESADIRMLPFQMSNNENEKEVLWRENAERIMAELEKGRDAAFLTLGDLLTYSTYGYLVRAIKKKNPLIHIESVPGIPSYLAAASRLNLPLVEGDESLLITSGARGGKELRKYSKCVENVVLLKTYKHIEDINKALSEAGLIENSRGISRCGREDEEIFEDVRALEKRKPDYWSLIIAKRKI